MRPSTLTNHPADVAAEAVTGKAPGDERISAEISVDQALSFQSEILPRVSRTFALTIPQLPSGLRDVVANAYLLCRIADTIEDEVALNAEQKTHFHQRFVAAIAGTEPVARFARELTPLLSEASLESERVLIAQAETVLCYTHSLHPAERNALHRCVSIMCRGMGDYQRKASLSGLPGLRDLDHYCYFVAGVVGEMLTELFCHYLGDSAKRRAALMQLSRSFGLGLQMTNILKDVWEDRARGVCWWPQDIFAAEGIDLSRLEQSQNSNSFVAALQKLVGVAHGHLQNALHYTQLIPSDEAGIRRFCLWAIGLAVLTLQNIHQHPEYHSGQDVKVSRKRVKQVITLVSLGVRSNFLLNGMFRWAGKGLPLTKVDESQLPSSWSTVETLAERGPTG